MHLVSMRDISKAFGGVQALSGIDFTLLPGEIHALAGENGAGKSTFVKILAGAYAPDTGTITVGEKSYPRLTPELAREAGIAVVHQEFNLLPDLSVAENVFLGSLPSGPWRTVFPKAAIAQTAEILGRLGSDLDPRRQVIELTVAEQQLVEVAKALAVGARSIIMDEPSTVLSPEELNVLYGVLRRLRADGCGVIYISHRLSEVFDLADRVTVFKDGRPVSTCATADITPNELIRRMVGRPLRELFPERRRTIGDPLLEARAVTVPGKLRNVSVTVRSGEIVGLAGLGGSGRTTVARALVGLEHISSGEILLCGKRAPHAPGACARAGLVMVPEDRKTHGIIAGHSMAANLSLASLRRLRRIHIISARREGELAQRLVRQFDIRPTTTKTKIQNLSGGNQQKVVLARWLAGDPRVVVLDEPTRGVDVGAKAEIYSVIEELSERGVGVLLASSDLTELLGTCDRIVVLHEGEVAGEVDRSDATEEVLLRAAAGADKDPHE